MQLDAIVKLASGKGEPAVAVAAADDAEVLQAVAMARDKKIATFLLFGHQEKIRLAAEAMPGLLDGKSVRVIHAETAAEAASLAVKAVKDGSASVLMKGLIPTAVLLRAVLDKESGLQAGKVLSHIAAFEVPGYDRLIFVTDAAMNIAPDLKQKADIIRNAVRVAQSTGVARPRVAGIAALETVNPAMAATMDAAVLTQMNRRGQIADCIVDGPLALDVAVSEEAARHKGLQSEVAGRADILLVPAIETGNALYKSLIYFAGAKVGAVIAGASAPVVLTSRSDSADNKLFSLALALCSASK